MRNKFLVDTFEDAESLTRAVSQARRENFRVYDVYSPFPIHGMDEALGIRRTRLPWVTFLVGLSGLIFALSLQFYTAVLDWPVNVGGKPDNSTLAFVPISFELTVLTSGLMTVAALFLRSRLFPGKRERLVVEGVTNDVFAMVLRRKDNADEMLRAREILEAHGAGEILEKEAAL